MDLLQRAGKYPLQPHISPILGVEFSGTVVKTSSNSFAIGDAVFGLVYGGCYAEYVTIDERMAIKVPSSISLKEASAIPEAFFTALQALKLIGQITSGDSVLIHAGGSGVGMAAIQIAKALGCNSIFVTAGTDAKLEQCKVMGATHTINYKTNPDFGSIVNQNGGVDVILDFIGAPYFEQNISVLKRDGRLVMLGLMGGFESSVNLGTILSKRLQIIGTTLRSRSLEYQIELRNLFVEMLLPLFGTRLKPVIDSEFSWVDVSKAHERMQANLNTGKILCSIPQ
jgi:putative PIG3 family NAD(P)H quinone oxidoreductase